MKRGIIMFGKNKKNLLKVCHYEGLEDFMQDYPCEIEMDDFSLYINKIKPETKVSLAKEKIIKIDVMEESQFMLQFHNNPTTTDKGIKKIYLVITYNSKDNEKKHIAFWGTSFEYSKFIKLQNEIMSNGKAISYSL